MSAPGRGAPAVSILVAAYNAQSYLGATLDSALAQSFRSFEIIVVDDGSTDDTGAIARSYRQHGVLVLSQANGGPAAARNRALSVARGRLIALLDSDDLWEPDCLETMVRFLDDRPDVSIAFCDSRFFGDTKFAGKTFHEIYPPRAPITFAKVAGLVSNICLDAVVRREVFDRIGWFDETLRAVEDFDLWLRALYAGCRIEPVPRVLTRYRRHPASVTAQRVRAACALLQVLDKWRGREELDRTAQEAVERTYALTRFRLDLGEAREHIRAGEFAPARAALRRACAYRPTWRYRAARLALAIAPGMLRRMLRQPR